MYTIKYCGNEKKIHLRTLTGLHVLNSHYEKLVPVISRERARARVRTYVQMDRQTDDDIGQCPVKDILVPKSGTIQMSTNK